MIVLILWIVDDVDEGVVGGHKETMASGKRSPDLRSAVGRDIKEIVRKSFLVSSHQAAATEMQSRTGSPTCKLTKLTQFSDR